MRYCSFRAPLQRGSWAAWAGQPQVLSHVAATTCRAWIPTLKARRASPKVARNGGFPAQFEHLYTTLTWRFLGWSSRDIVCCESSAFILRPSSFTGAAVPARRDGAGGLRDVQGP